MIAVPRAAGSGTRTPFILFAAPVPGDLFWSHPVVVRQKASSFPRQRLRTAVEDIPVSRSLTPMDLSAGVLSPSSAGPEEAPPDPTGLSSVTTAKTICHCHLIVYNSP